VTGATQKGREIMKQLGTTDAVNACDCCGKTGLKFTFAVELESGEVVHYGSTCVTKHTGKTPARIQAEIYDRSVEALKVKESAHRKTQEFVMLELRMAQAHKAGLIGRPFKEFCAEERQAAEAKRAEIFAKD
jgi:hypothetical protein